jgi:hypothetical protein
LPDRWAEFRDLTTTFWCVCEQHQDCPHYFTAGVGFSLRRLRPEFDAILCQCSCHASCPVAVTTRQVTVPVKDWYASCTCPGAGRTRQTFDQHGGVPDFDQARERARARQEAYQAARARAPGKSRDDIKEIYLAELDTRGMKAPAGQVLDAIAARIEGNPLPAVRLLADGLVQAGKSFYKVVRQSRPRR